MWAQILLWLFLWPVALVLLAVARPPSDRPKFIALAVAGAALWVGVGVASAASDGNEKAQTASPTTTTTDEEVVVTTTAPPPPPTTAPPTTTAPPPPPTTAPPTTTAPLPPPTTAPPATVPPTTEGPFAGETISQRNARQKAADYLEFTSFSRSGLIDQLVYEGFTQEDAAYGAGALNVDWNEQAAKKAAQYLEFTSFSRSGLIDQLVYEGFTQAQAEYGVSTTGL